jgi:hypothetical protein
MRAALRALLVGAPIGICCLIPATASALCYRVAGSPHAVCVQHGKVPKAMIFDVSASGEFVFVRQDSGVDQNACGNASGTTPNGDNEQMTVAFDGTWERVEVPFGPVHAHTTKTYEGQVDVPDVKAIWKGFNYDGSCNRVTWPAHGGWCSTSGSVEPHATPLFENVPGSGEATSSTVPLYVSPVELLTPLGSGQSCIDSGGADHAWSDAFGGGIETPAIDIVMKVLPGKGEAAYNFASGEPGYTVRYPPGFKTNCSDPSAQLTCSEDWSPPGSALGDISVEVKRVGIVK